MQIEELGWNSFFQDHFVKLENQNLIPARVAREDKNLYLIYTEKGEMIATVSGRFRYNAIDYGNFPAVGDWVAVKTREEEGKATIHSLLPRKSKFSRKVAGFKTEEQVLASNIDTVFLVSGLDENFNLRRIERHMTIAWDSGATPVIILNKTDLCDDVDSKVEMVGASFLGVTVLAMSAVKNEGLTQLQVYMTHGNTSVFLGSSGVGKSTIINGLLGDDRFKTGEVRESDSKGRHTTTHREMIFIPTGGIVIDTPGMRELQLWTVDEGIENIFGDIEDLTSACRFSDCSHIHEPGCAIQEAIDCGRLNIKRFNSYLRLQEETKKLTLRQDDKAFLRDKKKRNKQISMMSKKLKKMDKNGYL